MAPADQKKSTFEAIDKQVDSFALDASDKPVKFRQTERMKHLNRGQLPYNDENFTDNDYISQCLSTRNYRMLFAYMNTYGYDHISFEMSFNIPLPDVLALFPQGCFGRTRIGAQSNILTCIDFLIIYCWLFGILGDVVSIFFTATLYMKVDFNLISSLDDLKQHPFEVIKQILRNDVYRHVILRGYIDLPHESKFLDQTRRTDFIGIRNDVISLVNGFLKLLDPYLSFYQENRKSYRLAFIPWSLSLVDFDYFSHYNDSLKPFRQGLFDFGPLPVWSKVNHLKYPLEFKQQVKTILLMKLRKGNIVNRLFHKDLFVVLFQYMAFNALLIEEEEIQHDYRCTINDRHDEDHHKSVGRSRKHQRRT